MILLLGATSYIGQAFARGLRRRKDSFIPLSRNAFDYTRFEFLFDYVRKIKPHLIINAAEYSEKTNEDLGELERLEMLQSNAFLPHTVARVCGGTDTPWAHVSSGSIYTGAKIVDKSGFSVEKDLSSPDVRRLFAFHPKRFQGFSELDEPNFSFKSAPCTFYSGTKALGEEAVRHQLHSYVWRFRLPFNEEDEPRNFLSQLRDGRKFRDAINSLSHIDECVGACLSLWELRAPFGIYNIVNPGAVRTHDIAQMVQRILKPPRQFELLVYDQESSIPNGKEVGSDCMLDISKLLRTGIRLRNVQEAIQKSLEKWVSKTSPLVKSSV